MTPAKSKHRRTQPKPPTGSPPERFFEKDLAGEDAPSFQTMQTLFNHAAAIHSARPWSRMEEDQLIAFQDPASGQTCFCSVMGALGEAAAIQVYIGPESYFWFKKVHAGEAASLGDYFAQHSIFVHYVSPRELTPPDRQLAKTMGHPLARGSEAPVFRTIRPGYHPWFVTESEARILALGLKSVLVTADTVTREPDNDLWIHDDVYPLVEFTAESAERVEYTIRFRPGPSAADIIPTLPPLDRRRIQPIRALRFPSAGTLEVDHFYSAARIGAKHERKACMRIALAIDSKTAVAFPPAMGAPDESTGTMLHQVVLSAIEANGVVPIEVHVLSREFKILLNPLAEALGFRIRVRETLPALQFARNEMQAMLGDSGPSF